MKILLTLLITITLFAEAGSIDEQIQQLQNATPQTRYKLMNAIKMRISSMNAAERSAAISKLQKNRQNFKTSQIGKQTNHSINQMQQMNRQQRHQNGSQEKNKRPHQGNGNGKH